MAGLIATAGETKSSSFKELDPGLYSARCIRVIDLGTQKNEYQGNVKWQRQVLVVWEVPSQLHEGTPMTISKFYTLSLFEKAKLAQDLTSWRGKPFTETEKQGFDISKLLGVGCTLNVIQNERGKIVVHNIMPLNDTIEEQFHPSMFFSVDEYLNGNEDVFDELSDGIRNIVLRAQELQDRSPDRGDGGNGAAEEVVPF
jgi:hypothetical protein